MKNAQHVSSHVTTIIDTNEICVKLINLLALEFGI
jgi:hypothetical protein